MNPKLLLGLALILGGGLFGCSTAHNPLPGLPIRYHNAQYDLTVYLPADWQGYSVLMDAWKGMTHAPENINDVLLACGPMIVLRNPQWKTNRVYQDIPIYIFMRQQWDDMNRGKFNAAGAGGVLEELWHDEKYVFCIHSRYNADDSVNGWKEAQDIIDQNCAAHPEPHLDDR